LQEARVLRRVKGGHERRLTQGVWQPCRERRGMRRAAGDGERRRGNG
jgi:hypothetical protein